MKEEEPYEQHRYHKQRFCFIAAVMMFLIVVSYIIIANAMIFKIVRDVIDDEMMNEEMGEKPSESPSNSYEEIDKFIPIAKGPLRIESPQKIPVLN